MTTKTKPDREPIDLGRASAATRGVAGPPTDEIGLFRPLGLSDD